MKKIKVELENCYGINNLVHEFDFSKFNTILIYASNGVMKTSFAKTFKDISKEEQPSDRIHNKPTKYIIEVDGNTINHASISVIKSFENINTVKSQSKLLVDGDSKKEYDEIFSEILEKKNKLIIDLNKLTGIKKNDLEQVLINDFGKSNFNQILIDFEEDNVPETNYSDIKYIEIFNPDVVTFLQTPNVAKNIELYFEKYNKLIGESEVYKKGVFNPTKADNVATSLKKENFFEAEHKIKLKGSETEYYSYNELNQKLLEERKEIIENEELLKIEHEIKKKAVKDFRELIERTPIISELKDLNSFKLKLWKSYFQKHRFLVEELNDTFRKGIERLTEIEQLAKEQETIWDSVIEKFNNRFFVPFTANITNKTNSILGKDSPIIEFIFEDPQSGIPVSFKEDELGSSEILSQGEKRAMYLLNVIFNIEVRKQDGLETIFIIDDIADSFDYKNKYAIIQYLNDLTLEEKFNQIILTHNFDFFRSIQSRILTRHRWEYSFVAYKDENEIKLIEGGDKIIHISPFNKWKEDLSNERMFLASIPFVRNLIEFKEDEHSTHYKTLTSLLHIKTETKNITISNIKNIYDEVINCSGLDEVDLTQSVFDIIERNVTEIMAETFEVGFNLEEKIILSIGVRLKAEEYMWSKVSDKSEINKHQTWKLFNRFKQEYGLTLNEQMLVLDKVNLITPENIHVNSFMFEPILDLSINHLKELYSEVLNLKS